MLVISFDAFTLLASLIVGHGLSAPLFGSLTLFFLLAHLAERDPIKLDLEIATCSSNEC